MTKRYNVICPKCRKPIPLQRVLYRCATCNGPKASDAERTKHYEYFIKKSGENRDKYPKNSFTFYFVQPKMPRIFKTKNKRVGCPVCGKASSDMYCPDCYAKLNSGLQAEHTEIISVVGIKGCGKTVYISALINRLENYFAEHNVLVTKDGDFKHYPCAYGERLPDSTTEGDKDPVLLHLGKVDKNGKYPLDLYIYDIAGETLVRNDEISQSYFGHIALSSLVIYLFDPIDKRYYGDEEWRSRPEIKEHRQHVVANVDNSTVLGNIMENANNILRQQTGYSKPGLPAHLAACVASVDFLMWKPNMDPNKSYKFDSPEFEYNTLYKELDYSSNDFNKMQKASADAIRDWLRNSDESNVMLKFQTYFKKHNYFGVSSLGPNGAGAGNSWPQKNMFMPRNVLNPILWFLGDKGLLKVIKFKK